MQNEKGKPTSKQNLKVPNLEDDKSGQFTPGR
jgi:hypothetical protein